MTQELSPKHTTARKKSRKPSAQNSPTIPNPRIAYEARDNCLRTMSPTKDLLSSGALAERSPNTLSPTKSVSSGKLGLVDEKTAMPRFEPPQLRTTAQTQDQSGVNPTYISPSDAIRSPTTKKLSELKGKRFMNAKPKTLFAQTVSRENIKAQGQNWDDNQQQK